MKTGKRLNIIEIVKWGIKRQTNKLYLSVNLHDVNHSGQLSIQHFTGADLNHNPLYSDGFI